LQDKILKLSKIDSTHKFALRSVESGRTEECVIVAESQTAGIGRCGRRWESPRGNLYCSIIRKFSPDKIESGKLSLAVACAVHSAISRYLPEDLYLHWPNDVHYKKSKIAGILIAIVEGWVIISLGVNVGSAPDGAVSMKDAGCIVSTEDLLENVLTELKKWLEIQSDFGCLRDYWLRYINEINRKIIIRNGLDSLTGLFRGLDDSGRLILEWNGQHLFISSGDMFLNMEGITVNYE
jgi:BirA family biotin operon repressor/biotin-[acetyl-CoA-carboxylase] ligase